MQRPPATGFQIVQSHRAGRLLTALSLIFAGVPLYGWLAGMPIEHVLILAGLWLATSAWLMRYWYNVPRGRLGWDGDSWHWSGAAEPLKAVAIQYDFQTSVWLLLLPTSGQSFGVWMDADPKQMSLWRSMRRALVGADSFRPEPHNAPEVGR
ncbi:MAG: hypothetical protein EBR49_10415 [Betaproteobacteria bacterium]|nr:hypothetical protein [Betaproteobacteria bacterium]